MIKKLVGYVSEWMNHIAFENGFWIGYAEGLDQGYADALVAHGLEEEE